MTQILDMKLTYSSKEQTRWTGLCTRWSEIAWRIGNKTTAHRQDRIWGGCDLKLKIQFDFA